MMEHAQGVLQSYPSFFLLTICTSFLIAVILHCCWNWRRYFNIADRKSYETTRYYDDYSQCNSSSCVRCQNYGELTTNLRERFIEYRNAKTEEAQGHLMRLQMSVEAGLSLEDKPDSPSDSALLQNPNIFALQGLSASPWYDGKFASDIAALQDALPTIKQEYRELLTEQNISENFDGWLENSVPDGMWSVFHFFNQGERVEENCAKCPKTVEILDNLQAFMRGCAFGNAVFSVLEAGTHITEHYGPSNLRIRCHLGLHIPANCTLTVAHQAREWSEGKCLLFDDSFLHEARHDGREDGGPRVVLMVDFWHPDITAEEKDALCHLFSLK